jgi:hypothetical protein
VDHILAAARADHGIELVGPLPPDAGWQVREQEGFDLSRFAIDWDRKQVTCLNGTTSRNWHTTATGSRWAMAIWAASPAGSGPPFPAAARRISFSMVSCRILRSACRNARSSGDRSGRCP